MGCSPAGTSPSSARPQQPRHGSRSWPHSTLFCPSGKAVLPAVGEEVPPLRLRAPACPLLPCSHSRCSQPVLPAALLCRSGASWRPAAGSMDPAGLSVPAVRSRLGLPCPGPCGLVTRLPIRSRSCEPTDPPPAPAPPPPATSPPFYSVLSAFGLLRFHLGWKLAWVFARGPLCTRLPSEPEALGARVALQSLALAPRLHFSA